MLGDLGADVIKIEATWARGAGDVTPEQARQSHLFPDGDPGEDAYNRQASFNKLNRNRRGLTLELGTAAGKRVFEDLVRLADVVIENFSPRVMDKLGLGWDRLHEINPSVVYVSMPGFGSTGPYSDWLAFGPLIEAASGLANEIGYPDSGPYRSGLAWPDPVAGVHAGAASLIALGERNADP
ncbi:MAG: CoA transferase, partial [SAR324 cluster bacterium]|nr:CoA transferase [SAR324 cluster bacterium]